MDIYLMDERTTLRLPVNPENVEIRREKLIETKQLANIGEVDFPAGEKVKEITFSSFFPARYDPSYCRYPKIPDPAHAMQLLTSWTASKKPVRLLITKTPVNVLVLVSAHVSEFRGGEPGDIYYTLTVRPWRQVRVQTAASAQSGQARAVSRPDTKPVPKVYVVKPGDSLWKIARLHLGSGARWREIYAKNQKVIGPDPNRIRPGMRLVIG